MHPAANRDTGNRDGVRFPDLPLRTVTQTASDPPAKRLNGVRLPNCPPNVVAGKPPETPA